MWTNLIMPVVNLLVNLWNGSKQKPEPVPVPETPDVSKTKDLLDKAKGK